VAWPKDKGAIKAAAARHTARIFPIALILLFSPLQTAEKRRTGLRPVPLRLHTAASALEDWRPLPERAALPLGAMPFASAFGARLLIAIPLASFAIPLLLPLDEDGSTAA